MYQGRTLSNCNFCNRTELLPFTCRYCGRTFCAEHQLPENHHCQRTGSNFISMQKTNEKGFDVTYTRASLFRTSRTEIFHLIAGILVFFIVDVPQFLQFGFTIILIMLFITASAFTIHEIAHKLMAQQYGLWSEFRLNPFGVVISVLTAFSPFKIIAPGAVLIFGVGGTKERIGKIVLYPFWMGRKYSHGVRLSGVCFSLFP